MKIKTKIDVFHPAPWLRNGRNMRGLIWRTSLVTTEEQLKFVEAGKMKNPAQYDRLRLSLEVSTGNSPL